MRKVCWSYVTLFAEFSRNSLIRDMTFRVNFIIQSVSTMSWTVINLLFYVLLFRFTDEIGHGWHRYEYFSFIATAMIINSVVRAFIMPNLNEFSEQIRTGDLDFALLKPMDTQFLVSLRRIEWAELGNLVFGLGLLAYSCQQMGHTPGFFAFLLYPVYLMCGVLILYSIMICLSASSIFMGRNQSLYRFWFYITSFSRYPMEIYGGTAGQALRWVFTFLIPVMIATNVPARLMAKPMQREYTYLAVFALVATGFSLWASRRLFSWAITNYRSASS